MQAKTAIGAITSCLIRDLRSSNHKTAECSSIRGLTIRIHHYFRPSA